MLISHDFGMPFSGVSFLCVAYDFTGILLYCDNRFMRDKNWHLRLRASFCLSDIRSVLDVTQAHRTLLVPPTPHVRTWEIAKNVKNASAVSLRWHIYVIIYLYIISIIYIYNIIYDSTEKNIIKWRLTGMVLWFLWPWCQSINYCCDVPQLIMNFSIFRFAQSWCAFVVLSSGLLLSPTSSVLMS